MKELNEKQQQFCYLYVDDQPLVEIARKLDVHRNSLTRWLSLNEVKDYINEIRQKDVVMTLQDKRSRLMEIINGQSTDQVVNPKTGEIVELKSRTVDRIQALKLLMQVDGDLQDNKTITIDINVGGVVEAPKDAILIEDGSIIELDPESFVFEDVEEEEKGDEE
jgi:predicted DNA-binding protein YlxM (UPF0122 family)